MPGASSISQWFQRSVLHEHRTRHRDFLWSCNGIVTTNYPKRFVGGIVVDFDAEEVVIGAKVELKGVGETVFAETKTDDFGDFIFEQIEGRPYEVVISKEGYELKIFVADATELSVSLGDIALVTA